MYRHDGQSEAWRRWGTVAAAIWALLFFYWSLPRKADAYRAPSGQSRAAVWEVRPVMPDQTRPR